MMMDLLLQVVLVIPSKSQLDILNGFSLAALFLVSCCWLMKHIRVELLLEVEILVMLIREFLESVRRSWVVGRRFHSLALDSLLTTLLFWSYPHPFTVT